MDIHGIILSEADLHGYPEGLSVANTDISHLVGKVFGGDEGRLMDFRDVVGQVKDVKAIQGPQDCASDADRGLLDLARGKPFVRATAKLLDTDRGRLLQDLVKDRMVAWSGAGCILEICDKKVAKALFNYVMVTGFGNVDSIYRVIPGKG